jgi:hypothetical protein
VAEPGTITSAVTAIHRRSTAVRRSTWQPGRATGGFTIKAHLPLNSDEDVSQAVLFARRQARLWGRWFRLAEPLTVL